MFALGSILSTKREKLSRRLRQYRKYVITADLILIGGYILTLYLGFTQLGPNEEVSLQTLSPFVPFVASVLVYRFLVRFSKPHKLSIEERAFLKVCSALEDLGGYIEDRREPDRKRAEKKIAKISKEIEEWNIGSLELSKRVIGSHFKPFAEAFYRKLVGAVRSKKKDDLMEAYHIMRGFAKFLVSDEPKIENLDSMTKAMNEGISVTIPSRITSQRRILRSLAEVTLFRHIIVATVSIIGGYAVGHIGYYNVQVPIEYAYTMAVTVGLGINAIYWNYQRKG